jgi:undecaprenyl-diphosphatase
MVPGTSRSAATIIGALVLGASRKLAAEFSFYLAIPTILAASVYSLLKEGAHLSGNDLLVLSVGFFISFVVSLGVIRFLMDYIRKHSFIVFGYYRIVLAALVLLWLIWGKP